MCLSNERTSPHDDHVAARPVPKSQSAMPKDAPEMRQKPATVPAPATAIPIPATRNNMPAPATNTAAKIPAQYARSKPVIVSQQQHAGPRGRSGTGDGPGSAASGPPRRFPPQRGSIHAPTTLPHPLQEAPLNTTNTTSRSRDRLPSMSASGPRKWAAMAAVEDEVDIDSLQLTLSRSGSVTYAASPRMSMSSVGGVPTRTKTRERIVVMDQSGRRREYFR